MKKTLPDHADYGTVEEMGVLLPQKEKYTMRDFSKLVKEGWSNLDARWIVICSWAKYNYMPGNIGKCKITKPLLSGKFLDMCRAKDATMEF